MTPSPFDSPAPRGAAPYWLRPREEENEARQRELMARLERMHRAMREQQ